MEPCLFAGDIKKKPSFPHRRESIYQLLTIIVLLLWPSLVMAGILVDQDVFNQYQGPSLPPIGGSLDQGTIDLNFSDDSSLTPVTISDQPITAESQVPIEVDDAMAVTLDDLLRDAGLALSSGHFESADILYRKALVGNETNTDILYAIGLANQKMHNYLVAKEFYRRVLVLDPNHNDAFKNFFRILSLENVSYAKDKLLSIAKNNERPVVFSELALIYNNEGDLQLALKYAKKALDLAPQDAEYNYNMAVIYDKLKDYETAIFFYNRVLKFYEGEGVIDRDAIMERIMFLNHN